MNIPQNSTSKVETSDMHVLFCAAVDSYMGLREAADLISDRGAAAVLDEIANDRFEMCRELQPLVLREGHRGVCPSPALRRVRWTLLSIRDHLARHNMQRAVAEIEHCHEMVADAYREAIGTISSRSMIDVLKSHTTRLKAASSRLQRLMESCHRSAIESAVWSRGSSTEQHESCGMALAAH